MTMAYLVVLVLSFFHVIISGIQGQVITPSSVAVAVGDDVSLECTTTSSNPFSFAWLHVSTGQQLYVGGIKFPPSGEYDNFDLDEDTTAKTSTLIINDILRQDAGQYRCSASGQANVDPTHVTVEVGSVSEPIALNITGDDIDSTYQATCDAIGSSPEEIITWILDGVTQTDGIVETNPQVSDDSLFDKRSVFTFPSTPENYNVQLECIISGHQVAKLNRQETILVDIHKPPQPGVILIDMTINGTELTISCDDTNSEAVPAMSTLNIYSGGTLITKPVSDKAVTVTEPEQRTEFTCEGSNYLGTTRTSQFYGKPPQSGIMMIDFTINGTELTISCDDTNSAAVPAISIFNIYSNGALITKPESERSVTVTEPEQRTEFRCEGSNYLGTTTTTQNYPGSQFSFI